MRLFRLAAIGVLLSMVGLSQAAEVGEEEGQYISMEEITEEMRRKFGDEIFQGDVTSGLRRMGVQQMCRPWSCERGSNPNLVMTFAGRKWGSCVNMDHCLCGLMPLQMAYWCPKECRIDCGGTCATEQECPNGYAIENGQVVELEYSLPPPPWDEWICGLGTACPTPQPTPSPSNSPTSSAAPTISPEPTPAPTVAPSTAGRDDSPSLSPIWYYSG